MIFRYLARKHYLREIDKDRITKKKVAEYYNTSIENVEIAYKEYVDSKNPFRKSDYRVGKWIVETFISILSVVLVLFTLFEMQEERNATYRPNISLNGARIIFAWNEDGSFVNDYSLLTEKIEMDDSLEGYFKGFNVNIPIQNTGVGVAKDVYVDWKYEESLAEFQRLFEACDGVAITIEGNQIIIETNGLTTGTSYENKALYQFGYLQNSFETSEMLQIPLPYIELYELAYSNGFRKSIPKIQFSIVCKDVQGEEYSKVYVVSPRPELIVEYPEGGGVGMVNLEVSELRQKYFSITNKTILLAVGIIVGVSVCLIIGASCYLVSFLVTRKKEGQNQDAASVDAVDENSEKE